MESKNIRNFCIIAHIDHGKSTLADRFLEITKTVEKRKMREQFLDQMDLERERGITIKMQPVRMNYELQDTNYILNLIDTPGHIDFSYEVSRALKAVEGAILLIDATQGVQAQTITNVEMAKSLGLKIIPVINKIDLPNAQIKETKEEIMKLLGAENFVLSDRENKLSDSPLEILQISAKTGEGVEKLLSEVIKKIPPPKFDFKDRPRALVFDFEYSHHQGIIAYIRMIDGSIKAGDELFLYETKEKFLAAEVGIFKPERSRVSSLNPGEIGYIVTNIKKPSIALVGDTIVLSKEPLPPLEGYFQPKPMVWASIYPESQDDFDSFKKALEKLHLSDSALSFEEENNAILGRGFRCGFLGLLHLEIVMERLKREFNLNLITAPPTVSYKILFSSGPWAGEEREIYSPILFPDESFIKKMYEQWVESQIIIPKEKMGQVITLLYEHEAITTKTENFGDNSILIQAEMPLRELMRNFFDELKGATSGYGSLNYKLIGYREVKPGKIIRMDILIAEEIVPALSRIISRERVEYEARRIVDKLKEIIPRHLFAIKIQAKAMGRIIASNTIPALRKDVTGYLYGGDRTRKMKLWQKQKRGKKKLKEIGRVNIPSNVFIEMMK